MSPVKQSKSGAGGKRSGAGRKKGAKNAKTLEIEAAARRYAGEALKALVYVATKGESEPARVSAATALLDRAYGKPKQSVDVGASESLAALIVRAATGAPASV